ncbi:MAG: hypothetical protein ABIX12_02465 [Rubrivivax sp.]
MHATTPKTAPMPAEDGPIELSAEQIALVAGGSPKGTWLEFLISPMDAWADVLGSPKGTW